MSLAAKLLCCKCVDVNVGNPQNMLNTELSDVDYNKVIDYIYNATGVKLNKKICGKFYLYDNYTVIEQQLCSDNLLILLSDYRKLFHQSVDYLNILCTGNIKINSCTIYSDYKCNRHGKQYNNPLLDLECNRCILSYLKMYELLKQIHYEQNESKYDFVLIYDISNVNADHICNIDGMQRFLQKLSIRYSIKYDKDKLISDIFL